MKKFYVGVKGIVQDPERGFLLLKKRAEEGGFWEVAGGRVDGDESFDQTLIREFSEELPGVEVTKISRFAGAHRLQKDIEKDVSLVLIYFLLEAKLPREIKLSDEHEDFLFIKNSDEIPDTINQDIRDILAQEMSKK